VKYTPMVVVLMAMAAGAVSQSVTITPPPSLPLIGGDVTGNLTVSGAITGATATVTGGLVVDTTTLVVDAASNRVGVATSAPEQALHVRAPAGSPAASGTVQSGILRIGLSSGDGVLDFGRYSGGTGAGAWIQACNRADLASTSPLFINPNGGNVGVNTTNAVSAFHVNGSALIATNLTASGYLQTGTSEAAATNTTVGAIRYRVETTNAYLEAVLQTGASSYGWTVIKHNNW